MSVKEIISWSKWRWHCGTSKSKEKGGLNNLKILQLNICGWRKRASILLKEIEDKKIDVVILQETKLRKDDNTPKSGDFTVFRRERVIHRGSTEQPQVGLAILVRPVITVEQNEKLNLPSTAALETLGVTVKQGKQETSIWNVHGPPARGGSTDGELHLKAWPHGKDTVICADVNAHGTWDGEGTSGLIDHEMTYINNGEATRISGDTRTAPQITVVSAVKQQHYRWTVAETVGSDHLLLVAEHLGKIEEAPTARRWNYKKADWEGYERSCDRLFAESDTTDYSIEKENAEFIRIMKLAASKNTPLSTKRPTKA